jgi:hypothetical protein
MERLPRYGEALSPDEAKTPKNGVQRSITAHRSIQTMKMLPQAAFRQPFRQSFRQLLLAAAYLAVR